MIYRPQKYLIAALLLILVLGLLCLFSSCHQKGDFIKREIFQKQVIWVFIGLGAMLLVSRFDYRRLPYIMVPLYLFAVVSLVIVTVSGRAIMGAQRWISLGDFSFQPSEMGKFAIILVLARYFSSKTILGIHSDAHQANFTKGILVPLAIVMVPTLLVMEQPDLGTAIVYLFIFLTLAFLAEIRLRYLGGLIGLGLAAFPLFWHYLKEYQKQRLLVFLNPNSDPLGAGYTVIQSKIAIGSGRLFGKGWMSGTQGQLNFLAERHTDFIFSVWGEEWGLFGSLALVAFYAVVIFLLLRIAEMSKDMFGRLLVGGFAAVMFFHVVINIAMNIGMCPVVGLPLPLFSYGGSSLVINLTAIGVALNIARQR
jgi:rod shape determining protein RodA